MLFLELPSRSNSLRIGPSMMRTLVIMRIIRTLLSLCFVLAVFLPFIPIPFVRLLTFSISLGFVRTGQRLSGWLSLNLLLRLSSWRWRRRLCVCQYPDDSLHYHIGDGRACSNFRFHILTGLFAT